MQSKTKGILGAVIVFALAMAFLGGCDKASTVAAPDWVKEGRLIKFEDIPEADLAYLADWVKKHAKPAEDYFIELYRSHDLVIFGEGHNVREHKEFIINLIPRLYKEAGVRCIGWEFSPHTATAELETLVTAPEPNPEALLEFARRCAGGSWNSKEHWDMIEAVRKWNADLPPDSERMRFVGIDKEIDWPDVWVKLRTLAKDSPERQALNEIEQRRDVEMAENAERHILARGIKGLLFVGRGHDETHIGRPPDKPFRRPVMGKVLYDKYGDRVHQVSGDWGKFAAVIRAVDPARPLPIGFELAGSPFASVLTQEMGPAPLKTEAITRGYIYFGPPERLHTNTTIPGFVTEEMFAKYKNFYEIDFGKKFGSAREVNEYMEKSRWPKSW